MTISSESLDEHYVEEHSNIIYKSGTECFSGRLNFNNKKFIVTCNFGKLICRHYQSILEISSPIPGDELYNYECIVEVTDDTSRKYKTEYALYKSVEDWSLRMREAFPDTYSNNNYCTYTIDIIKK